MASLAWLSACGHPSRITLVHNQPLDRPVRALSLNLPATLILADGGSVQVAGVRMLVALVPVTEQLRPVWPSVIDCPDPPLEVELRDPAAEVTRVDYKASGGGLCGNMRGPVPKFARQELGPALVARGVALPTLAVFDDDPAYARTLSDALDSSVRRFNLLPDKPSVAGDAETARLARLMVERYPDLITTGIWLLGQTGDPSAAAAAKSRIEALIATGLADHDLETDTRLTEVRVLLGMLFELDPAVAREAARAEFEAYRSRRPDRELLLAVMLDSHGDGSAMDELARRLEDPETPVAYAAQLAPHFASRLDFPFPSGLEGDPDGRWRHGLVKWYREVRPQLHLKGSTFGYGRKALAAYRASMRPYADPSVKRR